MDFFIKINDKYIGLQIKPVSYSYIPEMIKERNNQVATHEKFTEKFGGKVFYIFSIIIQEIKQEIVRLNH